MNSLRRAYEKLYAQYRETELAKRARENILTIVSHDLRSPLSAILMNSSLMERMLSGGKPFADTKSQIMHIQSSAKRMNRLIEDLLDASKVERGQFRIEPTRSGIDSIIAKAMESSKELAEKRRIQVVTKPSESGLNAYCDHDRIVQVLWNLLGNSIRFSPEGSAVTVHARNSSIRQPHPDLRLLGTDQPRFLFLKP